MKKAKCEIEILYSRELHQQSVIKAHDKEC